MEIRKNTDKAYSENVSPRIMNNSRKLELSDYYLRK